MRRTVGAVLGLLAAVALEGCATALPEVDPEALPSQVLKPPSPAYREQVRKGRSLARTLVAGERLPGLSLAVAVEGKIVWAEGFGLADLENRTPVTPATLFRIGSVSEAFTAAAVGLLSQRAGLDLDAPLQRYLPGFPEKQWPLSTRQLMAHTAGIRPQRGEGEIFHRTPCVDDAERLARFAGDPLRSPPGTASSYSPYGWVLVGAVVAAVANEPYMEFMQREIFTPLGMQSTLPDGAGESDSRTAHFYYPRVMLDPRRGVHDAPQVDLSCMLPAGGYLSTPSDMVRFASAMMDGALLDSRTLEELQTPILLASGESTGRAPGWVVEDLPLGAGKTPTTVLSQGLGDPVRRGFLSATTIGGHAPGGTALLMIVPGHRMAIAVATNVSGAKSVSPLAIHLSDLFLGRRPGEREAAVRPAGTR